MRLLTVILLSLLLTSNAVMAEEEDNTGDNEITMPMLSLSNEDIVLDRAKAHGISGAWLLRVGRCESGGHINPNAEGDYFRGRPTSHGPFQLHEGGLLETFYREGYTSPYDVWQAADFSARKFAQGLSYHWSCK